MRVFMVEATVNAAPTTSEPKYITLKGYLPSDSLAWFAVRAEYPAHAAYMVAMYVPQVELEQLFAVISDVRPESPEFFNYDIASDSMIPWD